MPLNKACSLEALRENIGAEMRAGRSAEQASAIAHDTLRKACEEAGKAVPKTDGAEEGIHVRRYDVGEFRAPVRTPNGYLRCDARITRTGVFDYKLADGSTRSELRLPEEVFRDDSLKTFDLVPLTNGHPRERLTTKNTKRFAAGMVQGVRQNDEFVAAEVLITDEDAIKAAEEGGKNQLSCGYNCDLDFTPGTTHGIDGVQDGLRYDAIQRNITGNHVALVMRARAGADAALHLDADDAVQVTAEPKPTGPKPGPVGGRTMRKVTVDGIEFEMPEDAAVKLSALLEKVYESGDVLTKQLTDLRSHNDELEAALTEKTAKLDELTEAWSEDKVRAMVKERVALETQAAAVLREDGKGLAEMSEADIRKAVILKVSPSAKERLDEADEAYLAARYDAAVERWKEDEAAKPKPSHGVRAVSSVVKNDSKSARERMIDGLRKAGREPIRVEPLE